MDQNTKNYVKKQLEQLRKPALSGQAHYEESDRKDSSKSEEDEKHE